MRIIFEGIPNEDKNHQVHNSICVSVRRTVCICRLRQYTCEAPLMQKPVTITFTVEQTGENTYDFEISDDYVFVSPEVHGNKMSYTVGEGDASMKMVFKRK